MTLKNTEKWFLTLMLSYCGLQTPIVAANNDPVVSVSMTITSNNQVQDIIGGETFSLNHALKPENIDGAKGMAWRLDGYSNFATGSLPVTSLSSESLTIGLWCAPESYPMMLTNEAGNRYTYIAGNLNEAASKGFAFVLSSQGNYGFDCYTGGWKVSLRSSAKLPIGKWSHLVVTIDTKNRKAVLYNNGVEMASSKCLSPINIGDAAFVIGKSFEDVRQDKFWLNTFNGLIDDIDIYNKVLSQSEIAAMLPDNPANLAVPITRYATDMLRPAYHGMPATAWTNETHGAVEHGGKLHLFFQKNPNGPYMARLNWGHLVTTNLYQWEELPMAISPAENYDIKGCWSGAVFTDERLTNGLPNIFYTAVDNAKATIAQASPVDESIISWEKRATNPIIDGRPSGLSDDFRDPYIFKKGDAYYMMVGTAKSGIGATTLHHYDVVSNTWSNDGRLCFQGTSASANGTFWEMPTLTQIDGKWLFTVTPLNTSQGVETHYWIGNVSTDGTFSPTSSSVTSPLKLELEGMSKQGYGLLSPTIFTYQGKTLLMGIVPDKLPSDENYKLGWAHTYSLPREISITSDGRLIQKPYSGLQAMRSSNTEVYAAATLNGSHSLGIAANRKVELLGEFVIDNASFGFNFYKNGTTMGKLYYNPTENTINVDITGMPRIMNDQGVFNGLYSSVLPQSLPKGSTLKLHAFIDRSIMDVFVNDMWAFSMRLFPTDANANELEVFSLGQTQVVKAQAWQLDEKQSATAIHNVAQMPAEVHVEGNLLSYRSQGMEGDVRVWDTTGRLVVTHRITNSEGIISALPKGMYIVQISNGQDTYNNKIAIR